MKARTCDFCGTVIPDDGTVMIYDLSLSEAIDIEATTEQEKAWFFDAEDVCTACAKRIFRVLTELQISIRETAPSGSHPLTPVGGKSKSSSKNKGE